MFDKVITITVNPSVDCTRWIEKLDFEEPSRCVATKNYPGGKGVNVSRNLTALEISNLAFCVVGMANKDKFEQMLQKERVRYVFVENDGAIRENLTLIFPDEKLLKINFPGFSITKRSADTLQKSVIAASSATKEPLLVFAGSLPRDMTKENYKNLILSCKESMKKSEIILDNDIFSIEDLKELSPFIIKPNKQELAHMFSLSSIKTDECALYAQKLSEFIPHVLVSMDSDGVLYMGTGMKKPILCEVAKVLVKSAVGAGDATLSGFISALSRGVSIEKCVRFAAACGTASVQLDGTQAITKEQAIDTYELTNIVEE